MNLNEGKYFQVQCVGASLTHDGAGGLGLNGNSTENKRKSNDLILGSPRIVWKLIEKGLWGYIF